ncbi:hypothetical protein RRG08_037106 [Elysia crispata]|uniref:Uncharacterized protein n=1 Tax=Elysia crispata TaxID=231223 RepID=A0AAE0Y6K1_9GAST|nr:hypothetical protein RRG08_037106 [Elysia crispata]
MKKKFALSPKCVRCKFKRNEALCSGSAPNHQYQEENGKLRRRASGFLVYTETRADNTSLRAVLARITHIDLIIFVLPISLLSTEQCPGH